MFTALGWFESYDAQAMPSALRMIDANFNRAREALRVMEDVARFMLDDESLCGPIKVIRHDLCQVIDRIGGGATALAASRDTPHDVGTAISTSTEQRRTSTRQIVIAAARRLSEALRVIEEAAKLADADIASEVEQLRYRAYEAEKRLVLAMGTGRARQWRLCVLITESLCRHNSWQSVATQSLEAGVDCLQLREKTLPDDEIIRRASMLRSLAHEHGGQLIVNDRVDLALAAGANGVHLGPNDMTVAQARALAGDRLLIGVSTSSIGQAAAALRGGADYCGVGAMFETSTKHKDAVAGPGLMRAYAQHEPALPPHLAIGGITPNNVHEVIDAGACGVAVSSAVCSAQDPRVVCEALLARLSAAAGAAAHA